MNSIILAIIVLTSTEYSISTRLKKRAFNYDDPYRIHVEKAGQSRIMGKITTIENYPYIANIYHQSDDKSDCGRCLGTVITPYNIITVSSCIVEAINTNSSRIIKSKSQEFHVRLNSTFCNTGGIIIEVARILMSPDNIDKRFGIAMLELVTPTDVRIVTLMPVRFPREYYKGEYSSGSSRLSTYVSNKRPCHLPGWPVFTRRRYHRCETKHRHKKGFLQGRHTQMYTMSVEIKYWSHCSNYNSSIDGYTNLLCGFLPTNDREQCPVQPGTPLLCSGVQYGMVLWEYGCNGHNQPLVFLIPRLQLVWLHKFLKIKKIWVIYKYKRGSMIYSAPSLIVTAVILSRALI